MLMILPAPCPALLRPLLITEERKEREELEEEDGRVVFVFVLVFVFVFVFDHLRRGRRGRS